MDNLTHSLIGLAVAKAGLERLSPGATTLCVLAANSPDADIVALVFGGRWAFLHHHRGISHSIAGAFAIALTVPLVLCYCHSPIPRLDKQLWCSIPAPMESQMVLWRFCLHYRSLLMDGPRRCRFPSDRENKKVDHSLGGDCVDSQLSGSCRTRGPRTYDK